MQIKIGSKVKRNVSEPGYQGIGTVIEINGERTKARVQWKRNKTWYSISRLIVVEEQRG